MAELNNEANDSDAERGEWKIQLVMQNNCTFVKTFEDARTICSASKPVEVFMGNEQKMSLIDFLIQLQKEINKQQ